MQRVKAGAYRNRRIRLTGWLFPEKTSGGAALWLRVDMPNGDYILDNMLELKPQDARSKWMKVEIVAQVPSDALGISFGPRMKGAGQVWTDDLSLATVPDSVPTTTIERRKLGKGPAAEAALKQILADYAIAPAKPVNMSFEAP